MVTTKPEEKAPIDDNISMDSSHAGSNSWFSTGPSAGILPSFIIGQGRGEGNGGDASPNGQWTAAKVLSELRQRLRPWFSEFFRLQKFGWPPGIVAVVPRVKRNLQYFMTNYLLLAVILLVYCVLTSLLMLLTLIILGGLFYTIYQRTQRGPVIVASGYEIPPSLLYTMALAVCFPMFYFADVGGTMYWVIGSSIFLVLAHSVFYSSEEVPGAEFEVVTVVA